MRGFFTFDFARGQNDDFIKWNYRMDEWHWELPSDSAIAVGYTGKKSYTVPLTLMVSLYFGIGFITALNDVLIPHFKDLFQLTNVKALLVDLCFFGAYFVMSLPSGRIVGRIGYKRGIVVALTVMGVGAASVLLPASMIIFLSFVSVCAVCCGEWAGAAAGCDQSLCGGAGVAGDRLFAAESLRRVQFVCYDDCAQGGRGVYFYCGWGLRRRNWRVRCGCLM